MWTAMEMGARTEKDARREMEMRRRRQRRRKRRTKMRILLLNLCSDTYDQFIKNFICAS
jgi:hypothetical protein